MDHESRVVPIRPAAPAPDRRRDPTAPVTTDVGVRIRGGESEERRWDPRAIVDYPPPRHRVGSEPTDTPHRVWGIWIHTRSAFRTRLARVARARWGARDSPRARRGRIWRRMAPGRIQADEATLDR